MELKQYLNYEEPEILELYKSVGWSNYYENPGMLKEAYKNSLFIMGAFSDCKLIGIIRVVGDGYSIIYIQDIIVTPAYQRKGIGKRLLDAILEKYDTVYQKILLTDNQPKTIAFYKKAGFETVDKSGCTAFLLFHNQKLETVGKS